MASEKPDSFQCGAFEVTRSPDVRQFVEKLNRLREAVDACRIQPGVGYQVARSSGGTTLTIANGSSSIQPILLHPFYVYLRSKNKKPQIKIIKESRIFGTTGESPEIDGIDQWTDVEDNSYIYVETKTTDAGAILNSKIITKKQPLALVGDNVARILIATLSSSQIIQAIKSNLYCVNACRNGKPAVVVLPYTRN